MIIKAFDAKLLQVLSSCRNSNTVLELKVCNEIGEIGSLKGKISKELVTELFDRFNFVVEYENEPNIETTVCFFLKDAKETNNFAVLGIKNVETKEVIFENQKILSSLKLDPQLISASQIDEIKADENGKKLLRSIGGLVTIKNEGKDEIKGMLKSVTCGSDGNVYASVRVKPKVVACTKVDDKTNLSIIKSSKHAWENSIEETMML